MSESPSNPPKSFDTSRSIEEHISLVETRPATRPQRLAYKIPSLSFSAPSETKPTTNPSDAPPPDAVVVSQPHMYSEPVRQKTIQLRGWGVLFCLF